MSVIEPQVVSDMQLPVALQALVSGPRFQPMVETHEFDVGRRLKELIERSPRTQVALAAHMGVSPQAVQKWINKGAFAREHVRRICQFIDCTPDELFGFAPVAAEVASRRQSQSVGIDLEMLKSAIVSVKEALRSFGLELDAFLASPMIAYAYEVRCSYPRHMTKDEYRAFDRMLAERLQGELGVRERERATGEGQGSSEAVAASGPQAGRRRRAG